MKDIFNLENYEDLPEDIQKFITSPRGAEGFTAKIKSLFEIKDTLTRVEIKVGLYRKYNLNIESSLLGTVLHHLTTIVKKKYLKEIRKGVYQKIQ